MVFMPHMISLTMSQPKFRSGTPWKTAFRLLLFQNLPILLVTLNVRLQGRSSQEHNILGPHIFGKGPQAAKRGTTDNRTLFTNLLHGHDAVDVMTFNTPNFTQQVTYRDKNPDLLTFTQLINKLPPDLARLMAAPTCDFSCFSLYSSSISSAWRS